MRVPAALLIAMVCTVTPVLPQAASPPATGSPIDVVVSASWMSPNLDPVFDAYAGLEQGLGLRRWKNDGIRYSAGAEVRYRLMSDQQVVVEGSASGSYRKLETDASMIGLYRAGAGYRMRFINDPVDVAAQATLGAQWVNFSRTYNDDRLEINDTKAGVYVSLGATVGKALLRNFGVEGSLRYLFVPALDLDALKASVNPGGIAASIGFVLTL